MMSGDSSSSDSPSLDSLDLSALTSFTATSQPRVIKCNKIGDTIRCDGECNENFHVKCLFNNSQDTHLVKVDVNGISNTLDQRLTDYQSTSQENNLERTTTSQENNLEGASTSQEDIFSEYLEMMFSESTQSVWSESTKTYNNTEAGSNDEYTNSFTDSNHYFCNNPDNQLVQEGVNGTSNTIYLPLTDYTSTTLRNNLETQSTCWENNLDRPSTSRENNLEGPSTSQEYIFSECLNTMFSGLTQSIWSESPKTYNNTVAGSNNEYTNSFTDANHSFCNNPDTQLVQEGANGISNTIYPPLTDYSWTTQGNSLERPSTSRENELERPSTSRGNNLQGPSTSKEDIFSKSSQIICSESTQSISSESTENDNNTEAGSDDKYTNAFTIEIYYLRNNPDTQICTESTITDNNTEAGSNNAFTDANHSFCNNPDTQLVQEGANGISNTIYPPLTDYSWTTQGNNRERPSTSQENKLERPSTCRGNNLQPSNSWENNLERPSTSRGNNLQPSTSQKNGLKRPATIKEDIYSESSLSDNSTEDRSNEEYTNTFTNKIFNNCLQAKSQLCFICNNDAGPNGDRRLLKCCKEFCGRNYHYYCIRKWPIMKSMSYTFIHKNPPWLEVLICPRHFCRKCEHYWSEFKENTSGKLVTCVRCPVAYHCGKKCIPAGSEIISRREIICPAHFVMTINQHINIIWCIICLTDVPTLFCKTCPVSFHHHCIRGSPPDSSEFTCSNCEKIAFPIYGDYVWINATNNMLWPAKIIHPHNVPVEINNIPHEKGEFVVKCVVINKYHWKNHGCAFSMRGYANFTDKVFSHREIDESLKNAMIHTAYAIAVENTKKVKRGIKIQRVEGTDTWLQFQPLD